MYLLQRLRETIGHIHEQNERRDENLSTRIIEWSRLRRTCHTFPKRSSWIVLLLIRYSCRSRFLFSGVLTVYPSVVRTNAHRGAGEWGKPFDKSSGARVEIFATSPLVRTVLQRYFRYYLTEDQILKIPGLTSSFVRRKNASSISMSSIK